MAGVQRRSSDMTVTAAILRRSSGDGRGRAVETARATEWNRQELSRGTRRRTRFRTRSETPAAGGAVAAGVLRSAPAAGGLGGAAVFDLPSPGPVAGGTVSAVVGGAATTGVAAATSASYSAFIAAACS